MSSPPTASVPPTYGVSPPPPPHVHPSPAPPPPPRRRGWRAPLIAVLALAAAGAMGRYAWGVRAHARSLQDDSLRLGSRAGVLDDQLKTERASTVEAHAGLAACRDELETAQTGATQLEGRLVEREAELTACQANTKDLQQQSAAAQAQLEEARELTGKFQKMIDAGELDVKVRNGKMVVKLPDAILFPSGSAELSNKGKVAIAEVAAILKQLPGRRFTVAGHTDSVPATGSRYASNWALSAARAVAVTEALIEMGISAKHLVAAGYGPFDPIGSNSTRSGRQLNRRIEIVLEPNLKKVPLPKS